MNHTLGATLAVALLVALAGCGTNPNSGGDCRAGEPIACTCDDGRDGTGVCGVDGCDCPPAFALVAEPASVDWGEVARGASRDAVLVLRNPAPRAVRLRSIAFLGAEPGTFGFADVVPAELAAGGQASVTVRFTAGLPGTVAARLRIETDDGDVAPVEVGLAAWVPGALLACTPASVEFENAPLGGRSVAAVVCTNVGLAGQADEARLPLDRLEVTGAGFAAAWRDEVPAGGLAVGESATIEATFAPIAEGEHRGTLIVGGPAAGRTIPLWGITTQTPACDVEILPDQFRFGIVEQGPATYEFGLRNRRSNAPCTVRGLRLCEGTDPAFELIGGPYDAVELPPAGEFRGAVRFTPPAAACEADREPGCLEFELAPSPDGHRSIPFTCPEAPQPAVLVAPNDLDFGAVQPGCATREREVQVINTSSTPVALGDIEVLQGGDAFFVRSAPPAGTAIPPGLSVVFTMAYRPTDAGEDLGAVRVHVAGESTPYDVSLHGRAVEGQVQRDSFHQYERPKVDLLVVIDNGTTMAAEAARLVPELGALPDRIVASGIDFRLAVTTTGLVAGGACPGGASGGEDGRFFPVDRSRPRVLDENTPNLRATWEANLNVGTCHEAPPQAMEAALRALTPPLSSSADDPRHPEPDDGNLGFYRQDAHLSVLAISDRADASPGSATHYRDAIQALKGFRNTHLFNFHAITGPKGTGCTAEDGRSAVAGTALIDLVDRTDGGTFGSICGSNWLDLFGLATTGTGPSRCFHLGNRPRDDDGDGVISDADGELRVLVDDVVVPSSSGGVTTWRYDDDQVAVCFSPSHVPAPGSSIDVEYRVACLGW